MRNKILPARYSLAVLRNQERLKLKGMRSGGYTVHDDGWASHSKAHFSGVSITRTGSQAQTVAVCQIFPSDLHGVSIARAWEQMYLLFNSDSSASNYPPGFCVALPRPSSAFCSDDAGANSRGRRIGSIRIPEIIFVK